MSDQSNTAPDIQKLSNDELFDLGQDYQRALAEAQADVKEYGAEVARRFAATAKAAYEAAGKEHGKVSFDLHSGLAIEANTSKSVSWDNDKLMAIARDLSWTEVDHYFTVKFTMSETIYKGLLPGSDIKAKVDAARTVKYGDPSIKLVSGE